jgi:hypothetical protein
MFLLALQFIFISCLRFVFTKTKWHSKWDMILLPSSLRSNGRYYEFDSSLIMVMWWAMLICNTPNSGLLASDSS